jgi:hypothetical protein
MQISRRDLYNRLWSTPMIKLARDLDISDVGLAKACRRHNIPRPPRGYWAKLAAGKASPRPGLPPAKIDTVEFDAARHRMPTPPKVEVDVASINVAVAFSGEDLAGIAAATYERLSNAKPSTDGFVSCGSSRVLSCSLSPATVERACRILNAVERALPSVGARFAHDQEKKRVDIDISGERMVISIAEDYTRTETVKVDPKYSWMKTRLFAYHFTGDLRLTISGDFSGRKSWGDGKRSRLEQKLESFLVGLATGAQAIAQLRTDREEQRRRWEEQAREAEIARERQRRLRSFADHLHKEAVAWHRYCDVKAYVDHLQSQLAVSEALPEHSREWLRLAVHLARLTDPTKARLEALQAGISGYDYDMPFGRSVVG